MENQEISELAMQTAMSFKPFIDPKCSGHMEIVKSFAIEIQRQMNNAAYEERKKSKAPEMIEALKHSIEVIKWYMENAGVEDYNKETFFNIGANEINLNENLIESATTL